MNRRYLVLPGKGGKNIALRFGTVVDFAPFRHEIHFLKGWQLIESPGFSSRLEIRRTKGISATNRCQTPLIEESGLANTGFGLL
jgi:hypothetical protein